jgi:glucosamine-phosphate N-acetyltransferase
MDYKYDSLKNLCEKYGTEEIKTQYLLLLSSLTNAPMVSSAEFIQTVEEMSKMSETIVCYLSHKPILVGTGTILFESKIIHGCKRAGHIEDIVVLPSHRSQGIAKHLLQRLVEMGRQKNCYKVILDCKPELVGFYEKNGFCQKGCQMSHSFTTM